MVDNIELMHSYPDFSKDVIEAFQNLTKKYNLKPTANGICSVNFENQYCLLNFNLDKYNLQGLLFQKKTEFCQKRLMTFLLVLQRLQISKRQNLCNQFEKDTLIN